MMLPHHRITAITLRRSESLRVFLGASVAIGVFGYSAQEEPGRAENATLIEPEQVPTRLWIFLAGLPNRDGRGPGQLA